jgi:hypothetical protein
VDAQTLETAAVAQLLRAKERFSNPPLTKALELATEKKPNSPSPRSNKDISERQARGSIQPSETFASAALRYMACRRGCFAIEMATGIRSNAASLAGLIMHVEIVCKLS